MPPLRGLPSIIGSTPEVLRNRIREEGSIDVPEEAAEVVVGGPKFCGALRRDGLMFYRANLVTFVCSGSRCVEAGVEVWCSSCLGI